MSEDIRTTTGGPLSATISDASGNITSPSSTHHFTSSPGNSNANINQSLDIPVGQSQSGVESPGSSVFDLPVQSPVSHVPARLTRSWSTSTYKQGHVLGRDGSLGYILREAAIHTVEDAVEEDDVDDSDLHTTAPVEQARGQSYVVISGGTGCNSICSAFGDSDACYVLPVSDDGGSSSEIIRVLGGPSIGDIRSRLIRLIPQSPTGSPLDRIRNLLAYRLNAESSEMEARDEWRDIVEGRSALWAGIPSDRKEVIRGFLVYFEGEVLRRAHKSFSFRNGSVGNYFLAAAQSFFRSLPSAIFLFSSITNSQANIVPVLVTNHTVTIGVELENGTMIVGQCNISHPVRSEPIPSITPCASTSPGADGRLDVDMLGELDDSLLAASEAVKSKKANVLFAKTSEAEGGYDPLEARIKRGYSQFKGRNLRHACFGWAQWRIDQLRSSLFYINAYGHEIHPAPNPDFIASLASKDVLVYSCGSLWTSLMPCLALKGVATAIARSRSLKAKVLLLNSKNDRETHGYSASGYVTAIAKTLNEQEDAQRSFEGEFPYSAFVTHLVYLEGGEVVVDEAVINAMGILCVPAKTKGNGSPALFDAESVQRALEEILVESRG